MKVLGKCYWGRGGRRERREGAAVVEKGGIKGAVLERGEIVEGGGEES